MSRRNESAAFVEGSQLLRAGRADVARVRARTRHRRVTRLAVVLGALVAFLWFRYLTGDPIGLPHLPSGAELWLPPLLLVVLLGAALILPMVANSRSPHMLIRPEHIELGLFDVKGLDPQVEEVLHTLDVFMGYATFRKELGGNPRRGMLFEGPPGTGKTFMAKAMAKQAGVPFLFVSSPAFQSMWFGMTAARIRAFFKALRKAARREGGAIGFIEEIDAIGASRGALSSTQAPPEPAAGAGRAVSRMVSPGTGGMVNELLIQLQSFDQPPLRERMWHRVLEWLNGYIPEGKRLQSGKPKYHNILLIAATNRADDLDPALLRPGRFDRRLYFDLPTKQGRRDLIDFFLLRKAHHEQLEAEEARDRLAHDTLGYTPVAIEHLFDEALLIALRDGRRAMNVADVYEAKMNEEVGLKQQVVYTEEERRAVATHEAGHATVAHFLSTERRLEVLSIIKRSKSLGLLAHGDREERFTRARSELEASVAIALGGLVSEEVFLGQSGTGPANDLATATQVAATMVGALGMAGSMVSYEAMDTGPIAPANLVAKVLSDEDAKRRVEDILNAQKERVTALLEENRDVVEALRDALIERDELVGDAITDVIDRALAVRQA
ncbi:MAG: AAA family ATPase [Actinomycetota bacterium]|nr:AAA family ATPase [Actinomycetota bacterium]